MSILPSRQLIDGSDRWEYGSAWPWGTDNTAITQPCVFKNGTRNIDQTHVARYCGGQSVRYTYDVTNRRFVFAFLYSSLANFSFSLSAGDESKNQYLCLQYFYIDTGLYATPFFPTSTVNQSYTTWNTATTYAVGNTVTYNGWSYIATSSGSGHVPTGGVQWSLHNWSSVKAYAIGDASMRGSPLSFICLIANTNHDPLTSPTYWTLAQDAYAVDDLYATTDGKLIILYRMNDDSYSVNLWLRAAIMDMASATITAKNILVSTDAPVGTSSTATTTGQMDTVQSEFVGGFTDGTNARIFYRISRGGTGVVTLSHRAISSAGVLGAITNPPCADLIYGSTPSAGIVTTPNLGWFYGALSPSFRNCYIRDGDIFTSGVYGTEAIAGLGYPTGMLAPAFIKGSPASAPVWTVTAVGPYVATTTAPTSPPNYGVHEVWLEPDGSLDLLGYTGGDGTSTIPPGYSSPIWFIGVLLDHGALIPPVSGALTGYKAPDAYIQSGMVLVNDTTLGALSGWYLAETAAGSNDYAYFPLSEIGVRPIYITFSLDTYTGPFDWGGSLTVATELDSQVYLAADLAGKTISILSRDGIVTFTLAGAYYWYGFRILDITTVNPKYLIGNPNSEDEGLFGGNGSPQIVHERVDPAYPLVLLGGQIGTAYTYTMKFPSSTSTVWSVAAGLLPCGLTINSSTGVIAGTPTLEQEAYFTLKAIGSVGTVYQSFIIRISRKPIPIDAGLQTFARNATTEFFFRKWGSLYAMVQTGINGKGLNIYKSTDEGETWTRMDTAGEPPVPTGAAFDTPIVLGQAWDGADTVFCCYVTDWTPSGSSLGTVATLTMKSFDLRTDTWGPAFGGTGSIFMENVTVMSMVVLTTGVLRMFFGDGETGAISEQLNLYRMDNNRTAFGTKTLIATPTPDIIRGNAIVRCGSVTHQRDSFIGAGTVDVCHVWYVTNVSTGGPRYYLRVAANGTVSSLFTVPTTDYTIYGSGLSDFSGQALLEPLTNSLAMPFQGKTVEDWMVPCIYRGTPLEAPVWTKEYVFPPNPKDRMNGRVFADYVSLFRAADGTEAVIFEGSHNPIGDNGFTSYFICYRLENGHWSPREEFYSVITNPYIGVNTTYDPLDEIPFHAVGDPQGGFYFMFTGDRTDEIGGSVFFVRVPRGRFICSGGGGGGAASNTYVYVL